MLKQIAVALRSFDLGCIVVHRGRGAAGIGMLGIAAFAVLLLCPPVARAQVYWSNASLGDWSNAGNWSGNLVPTNTDNAWIVNGGTATITQSNQTCGLLSLGGTGGGTTQMSGGTMSFGHLTGPSSVYGGQLTLGDKVGANGTFNLNGNSLLSAYWEYVGSSGAGCFTQTGGTNSVNYSNWISELYVGNNLGSTGTYSLSGTGLLSDYFACLGYSGTGVFNQTGGTHSVAVSLTLGYDTAGVGVYNLSESGLLTAPIEFIGYSGSGRFMQSGGTNTISSNLYIGYNQGLEIYNLSGRSQLSASNEYVGYMSLSTSFTGSFTQSEGTNSVAALYVGHYSYQQGTYNLLGGVLVLSALYPGSAPGSATFNFGGGTIQAKNSFSTSMPMALGTSAGGATFDTAGYAVTLSGSLSGPGSLTEIGSGTLKLAAANTYSGNTVISGGTLVLGGPLALQQSTLDTSGNGSLSFGTLTAATLGGLTGPGALRLANTLSSTVALSAGNNGAVTTYSGGLNGPGSLNKIGNGSLTLTGSNTYTGPTSINQGELIVNGSLASPVTVNSGGTCGGTGSLGSVTVWYGGHLAPGDSPGVMTLGGGLLLQAGAVMDFELGVPGASDEILMLGQTLALRGQQITDFNITPMAGFWDGTYTLIDAGLIQGSLGPNTSEWVNGHTATLAVQGNDLVLNVVPEPGTLALLGAGCIALLGYGLRRRRIASWPVVSTEDALHWQH